MKQNGRKGLSLPMEIIIGVVVLVVIALAVIMFSTGGLTTFGKDTNKQQNTTSKSISCQTEIMAECGLNSNAETVTCDTTKCKSCAPGTYSCGR